MKLEEKEQCLWKKMFETFTSTWIEKLGSPWEGGKERGMV
jgi:hypothetical protein